MRKDTVLNAFLACLIAYGVLICPISVQAGPPNGNEEEAENAPGVSADRHASIVTREIHPREVRFFKSDIQPNLDTASKVRGLLPIFEGVLDKPWFTTRNIENCEIPEIIRVKGRQVGCHTPTAVYVLEDWWEEPETNDPKAEDEWILRQLDFERHALCVGVLLNSKARTETDDLFHCWDALSQIPRASADELRKIVKRMGYFPVSNESSTNSGCEHTNQTPPAVENLQSSIAPVLEPQRAESTEYIRYKSSGNSTELSVPARGDSAPSVFTKSGTFATGKAAEYIAAGARKADSLAAEDPEVRRLRTITELLHSGAITPENVDLFIKLTRPK